MRSNVERHLCIWEKEGSNKSSIGELVISGNTVEFYVRDAGNASPAVYTGRDDGCNYKVITNGIGPVGINNSLDKAASYNVQYVLKQSFPLATGRMTSGITGVSFIIPELMDWFYGRYTVQILEPSREMLFCAGELDIPEIILHESSPRISIKWESSSWNETMLVDSRTEIVIKNQPRISVEYDFPVDLEHVRNDVRCIMRFWGLMIGRVTDAMDIRLEFDKMELSSWVYFNYDFSYNIASRCGYSRPRTTFDLNGERVKDYFSGWFEFCCDPKYDLIRNVYFEVNKRKDIFAEDIFVSYVRILEGYHLRMSGDEAQAKALEEAIQNATDGIKRLITTDEGRAVFSRALGESVPEWKFNSSHAKEIAGWIAGGFLGRKTLDSRLKELNDEFFGIIDANATIILNPPVAPVPSGTIDRFYCMIRNTRNYWSHFKNDATDVLPYPQLHDTVFVLKALIIMILFSCMGMDKETIRRVVCRDSELSIRTMYLRKDNEKKNSDFS